MDALIVNAVTDTLLIVFNVDEAEKRLTVDEAWPIAASEAEIGMFTEGKVDEVEDS